MSDWFKSAELLALTGDVPVAEATTNDKKKRLVLKGARWTQSSTISSSAGLIGGCILQFGDSSAALSSVTVGNGSSLTSPTVHEMIDNDGIIRAQCIRATFGAGSTSAGPLTVQIWGDYA